MGYDQPLRRGCAALVPACGIAARPWVPTRFDAEGVKEDRVQVLWDAQNVYSFFTLYANIDNLDPKEIRHPGRRQPEIDRWIISRLNSLVKQVRTERSPTS